MCSNVGSPIPLHSSSVAFQRSEKEEVVKGVLKVGTQGFSLVSVRQHKGFFLDRGSPSEKCRDVKFAFRKNFGRER